MLLYPSTRKSALASAVVLLASSVPQASNALPAQGNSACRSAVAEQQLLSRETTLLGPSHAAEHSRMRAQQCEAERGVRPVPAKGLVSPAAVTLKEDEAVRKAADDIALGIQSTADRVTVQAAVKASGQGRWSTPFVVPVAGITAVLLHTGKLMFWSYDPAAGANPANSNTGLSYLWDPATRLGKNITPPENIWCGGQTVLSDGRVFIAGGNLRYPDSSVTNGTGGWEGTLTTYTFDPLTETFTRQPDMQRGRWYPTTTKLGDNRVVINSGFDETGTQAINNSVEVFTPTPDMNGIGTIAAVGIHYPSGLYPLQFTLPMGQMLEAGPGAWSNSLLDPATWNWTVLGSMRGNHYGYANGISWTDASVTPTKQVVMVAGGHDGTVALAGNEWIDGNDPGAGWLAFPQWLQPRHNSNTVILPDGSLLTLGGNQGPNTYDQPLLDAELYAKPATDTTGAWQRVEPHMVQAAYHSSAILLPDATVLLSQDDMDNSAHKVQVYSPAYLFKGARPSIVDAPAKVGYGQTFTITADRNGVTSAVLVAPGAVTHANDMHQRVIKLPVQVRNKTLTATIPASSGTVPPGYYMLFVLDKTGVPSAARFVHVS